MLPIIEDGGCIINISSILTRASLPGFSAYAAMKGATEVLTCYLAKELAGRLIRVNTVAPDAIETDFADGLLHNTDSLKQFVSSQTALARVGLPNDIGPVVASLLQDDSGWVNAQRIEVSSGMFL